MIDEEQEIRSIHHQDLLDLGQTSEYMSTTCELKFDNHCDGMHKDRLGCPILATLPLSPLNRKIKRQGTMYNSAAFDSEELILFGIDFSHLSISAQFTICASGVFTFSLIYAFLQELIQIHIAGRKLTFFLAACQFAGHTFCSFVFSMLRSKRVKSNIHNISHDAVMDTCKTPIKGKSRSKGPIFLYIFLSIIRAADLGLTNLSMRYLNYPAKTLIKSSRVIFTMAFGSIFGRKCYTKSDYAMVYMLVISLCIFLHSDATTTAVFHPMGVKILVGTDRR